MDKVHDDKFKLFDPVRNITEVVHVDRLKINVSCSALIMSPDDTSVPARDSSLPDSSLLLFFFHLPPIARISFWLIVLVPNNSFLVIYAALCTNYLVFNVSLITSL